MTSSIAGIVAHSCWVNCFNFASCISPSQVANLLLRDEFRKTSKDSLEKAAVTGFWGTSGCSFRFTPPTIWCLVGSPCEGKEHSKILKKKNNGKSGWIRTVLHSRHSRHIRFHQVLQLGGSKNNFPRFLSGIVKISQGLPNTRIGSKV